MSGELFKCVIKPNTKTYKLRSKTWTMQFLRGVHVDMTTNPPTVTETLLPLMPRKKLIPLNNNIVVRKIAKDTAAEEVRGGIVIPRDNTITTPTEEVEIVAISADIKALNGKKLAAKVGDRALIHRGINGTKVAIEGHPELFIIGYVHLIAVLG